MTGLTALTPEDMVSGHRFVFPSLGSSVRCELCVPVQVCLTFLYFNVESVEAATAAMKFLFIYVFLYFQLCNYSYRICDFWLL